MQGPKVLHLQTLRNRKKAEQAPASLRGPKDPMEQRMDAQLEKLLEIIDSQQADIDLLKERVAFLNRALLQLTAGG